MSRLSSGFVLLSIAVVASISAGCNSRDAETQPKNKANGHSTKDSEFRMGIESEPFGETKDGQKIVRYLLTNANGLKVEIINYGATVTSVEVPDSNGELAEITLGFDDLAGYQTNAPYFGGICGRFANRIAGGKFTIDGKPYTLATNNGAHHLHGGNRGFNKAVWHAEPVEDTDDSVALELNYVSSDGEEGYPGDLKVTVVYTLTNKNELQIDYTAVNESKDKSTPLNLTNHCYWNLAGSSPSGSVLKHNLQLECDKYLPVDEAGIPTGELKSVENTPMDFRTSTAIGARIDQVEGGYDHCYVVNGKNTELRKVARIHEPTSGRVMEIFTTEPGVQLYTGNFLDGSSASANFVKHAGFCLECQHYPDSPNRPEFPNTFVKPGQVYTQRTVHKFSVAE